MRSEQARRPRYYVFTEDRHASPRPPGSVQRIRDELRAETSAEVRAEVAAELQEIIAAESAPAAREVLGCIADRLLDS